MVQKFGLQTVAFPQCQMGAPSRKDTTLGYKGVLLDAFCGLKCRCRLFGGHKKVLAGIDPLTGHFRSRGAQAYPPEMCKELAAAHLHTSDLASDLSGRPFG